MTTISMVQRIAQAMRNSKAWPAVFGAGTAEELARVALGAIREPTPHMLAETLPLTGRHCDPISIRLAEHALFILERKPIDDAAHRQGQDAALALIGDWRAMVDAALTEST